MRRVVVIGRALVLSEPLSFWGGFDPASGRITEVRHPDRGAQLAGQVLVVEATKGSSGGAGTIAEAIRRGTGPVAIVLRHPSLDVAIGTLTPEVLYGIETPYAVIGPDPYESIATGDRIRVDSAAGVERLG